MEAIPILTGSPVLFRCMDQCGPHTSWAGALALTDHLLQPIGVTKHVTITVRRSVDTRDKVEWRKRILRRETSLVQTLVLGYSVYFFSYRTYRCVHSTNSKVTAHCCLVSGGLYCTSSTTTDSLVGPDNIVISGNRCGQLRFQPDLRSQTE